MHTQVQVRNNNTVSIYIEGSYTAMVNAPKVALELYKQNKPAGIHDERFMSATWMREDMLDDDCGMTLTLCYSLILIVDNKLRR